MSQITIGGTIDTGASTPAIGVSVGYFQTVVQLRAYTGVFTTAVSVYVAGNQASNDRFGGAYTFDPASTAADDGYVTINQTSNLGAGRWVLNNDLPAVPNVAALRAMPSLLASAANMFVAGSVTPGDGLGGIYTYNIASVAPDDGVITINQSINQGAGRWVLSTGATALAVTYLQSAINDVVSAGDLVPSPSTPTLLLQSLMRVFGGNREKVTASAALTADNAGLVVVDCTGGNVVLSLPSAAAMAAPFQYIIVRLDSSANTLTTNALGTDTFAPSGASSLTIGPAKMAWISTDSVSIWDIVLNTGNFVPAGIANREAIFTANGSWGCPAGVTQISADYCGGGGGGAVQNSAGIAGGGGGGGAQSALGALYTVVPGTTYTVTIGTGGAAGTGATAGSAGGTTSLGAIFTALGGAGGQPGTAGGAGGAAGGAGGTSGGSGIFSNALTWGGAGGNSLFGAGGNLSTNIIPAGGGSGFGAGGGGGNGTAGAGSPGFIRLRF